MYDATHYLHLNDDKIDILSTAPLVLSKSNYLSSDHCEAIIATAKSKLQDALVSAETSGIASPGRTGKNCWLPHDTNPALQELSQSLSEFVGLPLSHAESLQTIYYGETEEYRPHYDAWDANTARGQRCMEKGGQRLITCLIYLNTPKQGGGTSFPKLNQEVSAQQGKVVIFHNCTLPAYQRHPKSLHGGMPVVEGEKWACNLWFRQKTMGR